MTNLNTLLRDAKEGAHPACQYCPWSPAILGPIAFGTSCCEHGVDYSSPVGAVSVQVAQDPGGSGAAKTGRLCFVCNSDPIARNTRSLWNAAVTLRLHGNDDKYLRGHYWANAIMHGAPKESHPRMEEARSCCSSILREQIQALSPKVVIALGKHATNSLFQIGLSQKPWDKISRDFSTGAYTEIRSWFGVKTSVYCTYHTGDKAVNIHAPRLYTPRTEELLSQRIEQLENRIAVEDLGAQLKGH